AVARGESLIDVCWKSRRGLHDEDVFTFDVPILHVQVARRMGEAEVPNGRHAHAATRVRNEAARDLVDQRGRVDGTLTRLRANEAWLAATCRAHATLHRESAPASTR